MLTLLTVEIRVNHFVSDGERYAVDMTVRHASTEGANHCFIGRLDDA